ncbi:unnamed protein product [Allacma fusca]|uniref:Uncharacterized protein n=1 Tax=Allacma fusca TaxID=39272 RepID=A0A8J2PBZ0_9HEXA|nr:unnamed protein product [Allacma fusca]
MIDLVLVSSNKILGPESVSQTLRPAPVPEKFLGRTSVRQIRLPVASTENSQYEGHNLTLESLTNLTTDVEAIFSENIPRNSVLRPGDNFYSARSNQENANQEQVTSRSATDEHHRRMKRIKRSILDVYRNKTVVNKSGQNPKQLEMANKFKLAKQQRIQKLLDANKGKNNPIINKFLNFAPFLKATTGEIIPTEESSTSKYLLRLQLNDSILLRRKAMVYKRGQNVAGNQKSIGTNSQYTFHGLREPNATLTVKTNNSFGRNANKRLAFKRHLAAHERIQKLIASAHGRDEEVVNRFLKYKFLPIPFDVFKHEEPSGPRNTSGVIEPSAKGSNTANGNKAVTPASFGKGAIGRKPQGQIEGAKTTSKKIPGKKVAQDGHDKTRKNDLKRNNKTNGKKKGSSVPPASIRKSNKSFQDIASAQNLSAYNISGQQNSSGDSSQEVKKGRGINQISGRAPQFVKAGLAILETTENPGSVTTSATTVFLKGTPSMGEQYRYSVVTRKHDEIKTTKRYRKHRWDYQNSEEKDLQKYVISEDEKLRKKLNGRQIKGIRLHRDHPDRPSALDGLHFPI